MWVKHTDKSLCFCFILVAFKKQMETCKQQAIWLRGQEACACMCERGKYSEYMHVCLRLCVWVCACDPDVRRVDVFLHLNALYVITLGGQSEEALAPASPASDCCIIRARVLCPDYQHLFPNRIHRTLWWHSIWGLQTRWLRQRDRIYRSDHYCCRCCYSFERISDPVSTNPTAVGEQVENLHWEHRALHCLSLTRVWWSNLTLILHQDRWSGSWYATKVSYRWMLPCFSSPSTNKNRGNGCLVMFTHPYYPHGAFSNCLSSSTCIHPHFPFSYQLSQSLQRAEMKQHSREHVINSSFWHFMSFVL